MLKEKIKRCIKINANTVGVEPLGAPKRENINKKIITNSVGADATFRPLFREHTKKTPEAYSNPNSKIQTLNSDFKGITLIALIITIIVMLILVGVTINVALNGGLFKKAEIAMSKTQEEIEKEQLMEVAIVAYDPDTGVNFSNMKTPDGFTKESDGKYKSNKTGKTYTIDKKTAEIKEYNGENNNITDIRLGGKWTNVTFKDLSGIEPNDEINSYGEDDVQFIFITNEENNGMWQIGLLGKNEIDAPCAAIDFVWLDYKEEDEDIPEFAYPLGDYENVFNNMTEYRDSGWYYSHDLDMSNMEYPISGTVVGIWDSNGVGGILESHEYNEEISRILNEVKENIKGVGSNDESYVYSGELCNFLTGTFERDN